MIIVKNLDELYSIKNPPEGENAYVENLLEIYRWKDGWHKYKYDMEGIDLNLYDLNRSIINQLTPMTTDEVIDKIPLIKEYYHKSDNSYHMLLCKDYSYYTIFAPDSIMTTDFSTEVYNIIINLGNIYSIEKNEDGAIEIWIKPEGEETPYAFYLFPYDMGVVYYG